MKKDGDIFCNEHRVEKFLFSPVYYRELVKVLGLNFLGLFCTFTTKFGINIVILVSLLILPDSGSNFEVSLSVKPLNCSSLKSLGLTLALVLSSTISSAFVFKVFVVFLSI